MLLRTFAALLAAALLQPQLPAPLATPWYRKITKTVPRPPGRFPTVPPGFTVRVYAEDLRMPRFMALAANGDVFVAEPARDAAAITVLRDADHDGVAERRAVFAAGLNRPFGPKPV